jgi:hypothetical protein
MNWEKTQLELYVESQLKSKFGDNRGDAYFTNYASARAKVLNEIKQIQGVEPGLSDHGPDHIADVMKQVLAIISSDEKTHELSALDLYILLLAVLFHDVGNLFGRTEHNQKIAEAYDFARGVHANVRREKSLVLRAAQAHTGRSSVGDTNTLIELNDKEHFDGEIIKLQSIAAILRFADELAEGPQRTTEFFRTNVGYKDSQVWHQYASCTNIAVDRGNGRICLTYEIELKEYRSSNNDIDRPQLLELLTKIRSRISKLDQERRYTRYYCDLLSVFKKTESRLNFWSNGLLVPLEFAFDLDDLVVPSSSSETGTDIAARKFGATEALADRLDDVLRAMEQNHDK